jgi:murein DD-endopeptidase MepM/ murein hydrolase activator NlpD
MIYRTILIIITAFTANIFPQELELYGKLEPGNVIIGIAHGVERILLNDKELNIDPNGYFVFGFDRDDKGEYLLQVKFKEGKVVLKKINLPERKYKIQKINKMKKELVTAPQSQINRIAKERKLISAAREKIGKVDTAFYRSGIVRPVKGGRVTSVFGSQRILNGVPKNPHNGYDIAAPRGTPVYAMADGIVVFAADTFYYSGNFIILDHGQGLNSSYLHLSKKLVKEGDRVSKGQKIGEIGTTGRSTGPHLHWSVQWYGKRTDPYALLNNNFPKSLN